MDHTRKKLIEELIRVGRLIDPVPNTRQRKSEDAEALPRITQQSNMDARSPTEDLEGLPVVDDVADRPYTTKDMFAAAVGNHESRFAGFLEGQQPAVNTSDSSDDPESGRVAPMATNLEKQLGQGATAIGFPVEELARELVILIEDRVNERTGEHLDDTFRDELTQAVIAHLEGWLKYD